MAKDQAEQSTALVNIQEAMRQDLAALSSRISTSGSSFINLTGKKFTFPDKTSTANPISCVVIDFINSNSYYDTPYKQGVITEAACHAVGQLDSTMEPMATSPRKQAEKCATCDKNQWGSGNGGGKACANNRILAVVAADNIAEGDILLIKAQPTAIKHFDKYAASVGTKFQKPLWSVITELSFSDDAYPSLRFNFVAPVPESELAAAYTRKAEALAMLMES